MAASMSPELAEEIEVVRAIYGDEDVTVEERPASAASLLPFRLAVDLRPRVEQAAALVSLTLVFQFPVGYPGVGLPTVAVERSRGLGDAALARVLAAAATSLKVHGGDEGGCISVVLAEVSESLDLANDESECSICLAACGDCGAEVVRAVCDHVFHGACLGRWVSLQDSEAEAAAIEVTQSIRAERDALSRDLAEAEVRFAELTSLEDTARNEVEKSSHRVNTAQAKHRKEIDEDEDDDDVDDVPLQVLVKELAVAKSSYQKMKAEVRKAQNRLIDLQKRYQTLDDKLASQNAERAFASLPCPVCRVPIERGLFISALEKFRESKSDGGGNSDSAMDSRVDALSAATREHVRRMQKQHAVILARRRQMTEAAEAAEAVVSPAADEGVARLSGNASCGVSVASLERAMTHEQNQAAATPVEPAARPRRNDADAPTGSAAGYGISAARQRAPQTTAPPVNAPWNANDPGWGQSDWHAWSGWSEAGSVDNWWSRSDSAPQTRKGGGRQGRWR
eukprot:TRINITY_DN11474_c0_g3_i1.p1 TRINITY_DN11474_c0_g3~~TRINITY_DN11474_c0_g3_i1.p1  ORF type:complete len:510 (-),score=100.81 TRINITY_DN11474_c0_g3_i1:129-1658(-)